MSKDEILKLIKTNLYKSLLEVDKILGGKNAAFNTLYTQYVNNQTLDKVDFAERLYLFVNKNYGQYYNELERLLKIEEYYNDLKKRRQTKEELIILISTNDEYKEINDKIQFANTNKKIVDEHPIIKNRLTAINEVLAIKTNNTSEKGITDYSKINIEIKEITKKNETDVELQDIIKQLQEDSDKISKLEKRNEELEKEREGNIGIIKDEFTKITSYIETKQDIVKTLKTVTEQLAGEDNIDLNKLEDLFTAIISGGGKDEVLIKLKKENKDLKDKLKSTPNKEEITELENRKNKLTINNNDLLYVFEQINNKNLDNSKMEKLIKQIKKQAFATANIRIK